ncbi:MAG: hypothetical protein HQL30_11235 [Candidatus Omnitrophica bacterium]|nr:hypothetical protein [Candidatus Omnitrophota bacterium]
MKRSLTIVMGIIVISSVLLTGCGLLGPSNGREAVDRTKKMSTMEEKRDYLILQAGRFMKKKQLSDAADIVTYALLKLDPSSPEAKALLEKLENAMAVQKQMGAQ